MKMFSIFAWVLFVVYQLTLVSALTYLFVVWRRDVRRLEANDEYICDEMRRIKE